MRPQALRARQKAIYNKGKPFAPLESLALQTKEKDLVTLSNPEWLKTKNSTGTKLKFNRKVTIKGSNQTIPLQSKQKAVISLNIIYLDKKDNNKYCDRELDQCMSPNTFL